MLYALARSFDSGRANKLLTSDESLGVEPLFDTIEIATNRFLVGIEVSKTCKINIQIKVSRIRFVTKVVIDDRRGAIANCRPSGITDSALRNRRW